VAFGLAPALQARGATIGAVLREGGRGASGDRLARLRPLLVTAQIALALVLLVGAGLLVRSFASLQAVEPGFATERVLSFRVTAGAARYPEEAHVREFHDAFHERLRATPGVESVTSISELFLDRLPNMAPITVAGRAQAETGEQAASVTYDRVDPGFFHVMSTPIVRGREFGPEDRAGGVSVVVVNETFVRRYFPGEDPIGQRFAWGAGGDDAQWRTIVGVAADARRSGLTEPVRAEAYISRAQEQPRGMEYLVRATGDPVALVPGIRAALRDMDPTLPIAELRTIDQALREAVATQRFVMLLLGGFAVVAVLLAAIGVYGVLSYLVGQRTQEIGIRMAVGASRPQVLGMVLRQAMLHVLPGVAIGVAGALAVTRLIRAQLFGVSPTDPLTFVGVATLLVAVALLASWIPAWRAAQVEPIVTLKAE
jgi:putative ABC transport system permease protein